MIPAIGASKADVRGSMQAGAGGSRTVAGGRTTARGMLVVVEVALSLVLLVGASLMIRSVIALKRVDVGVRPDRLLTLRVPLAQVRCLPQRRIRRFRGVAFLGKDNRRYDEQ